MRKGIIQRKRRNNKAIIQKYNLLDVIYHLDTNNLQIQQVTVVSRPIYGQGSEVKIEYVYNNDKHIDYIEKFYYTKEEATRALSTLLKDSIRNYESYIEECQNKLEDYKQKLKNDGKISSNGLF